MSFWASKQVGRSQRQRPRFMLGTYLISALVPASFRYLLRVENSEKEYYNVDHGTVGATESAHMHPLVRAGFSARCMQDDKS